MKREECLEELAISMAIGNLITLIVFAALHQVFNPLEVVAFWIGTWMVATYAVWTSIDLIKRKKRRDAWQSNHGTRLN